MEWKKKGKIFDTTTSWFKNEPLDFAQSPQALVFDDFIRIYFSTRKKEPNGKFISNIAFVEFDKNFSVILNRSSLEVIKLGNLGCFDEHGIFPINLLRVHNLIYAYTCGWSRRVSVSVETSTGLAISYDNGLTFKKIGLGPILTSSLNEPILVGDSFVKKYNDIFHMWYIFGKAWTKIDEYGAPDRIYKIAHATSTDGINWKKEEAKQIISDSLNADECQALPTVIKIDKRFHMYFCYREASDFRKNKKRGYKIGYAYSDDLLNWTRDDKNVGIEVSKDGWDCDMMCYPHIFEVENNIYLLYNGNEFGRYGFGLAQLSNYK